ncbi:heterokaryon incompatibility protein-domain-containing protein [Paraphoma chrysanthemicola]|uniref:Heterokaryon incompatibility protein-domain-containing protein n=1 Tax=Paraphoma chrysanthemicola TaxID=798071 RepID=A0A8K0RF65_9PLEO|nr:heterokaryon incompatibility protein-domain-containing protein [Paraphoma chrysanthemicola]
MASTSNPTQSSPLTDNFYSPSNYEFYAHQPYQHLDKDSNAIRLIRVFKTESGELQCRLVHNIPLAEAADTFTAISYCAGDPKQTRTIQVDGLSFNAFANLAYAIEQAYQHCSTARGANGVLLWADQICINQSNLSERSHQVGFMHEIYKSAQDVVACLSTADHVGADAITWIKEAHTYLPKPEPEQNYFALKRSLKGLRPEYPFKTWFWSLIASETFETTWCDVMQMIKQPWWSRAWICQEYMSAEHVVFIYGGQTAEGNIVQSIMYLLIFNVRSLFDPSEFSNWIHAQALQQSTTEQSVMIEQFEKIAMHFVDLRASLIYMVMRGASKDDGAVDLGILLNHSRSCKASDARDHVFAFLKLAPNDYGICVNYDTDNTLEDLFTEVARKVIDQDEDLNILSYRESTDFNGRSPRLPSWVFVLFSSTSRN